MILASCRRAPRQREVLGFPPAGHAYWNEETIAAVKQRYPGMDVSVYGAGDSK